MRRLLKDPTMTSLKTADQSQGAPLLADLGMQLLETRVEAAAHIFETECSFSPFEP